MAEFAKMSSVTMGAIKVTYLPDGGGIVNPTALYPSSTEAGWQAHAELLNEEGKFLTTIGSFLIETGDHKIVVDTGMGPVNVEFPGFGPFFGGDYLENFAATGVEREEVTQVVFTHLHLDHCGWTTIEVDGNRELTFPNAQHRVSAVEWEFWHGTAEPAGPHPEFVQKPLEGRIDLLSDGDTIVPGITVVATPGHTPGHSSLRLTSGDETLYLLGDVLHGAMQITERDWSVAFDMDAPKARETREALYKSLTKPNVITAANHFSKAVFGRIVANGEKYRWQPL